MNDEFGFEDRNVIDLHAIRSAHSIQLRRCDDPQCDCPHLLLLDRNNQPMAQAVLSKETVRVLSAWFD